MTKTGADISHHQATFDPDRYFAAGDSFVFLKATEGSGFVDPTFRARWLQVGAHPRGAYHFARPGGSPVDTQADHFIGTVRAAGWRTGDVWVLDLEDAGGVGPTQLVTWADRWCTRVRAALGGRGLFYSYIPFIRDTMGNPGRVPGGCLAWVARYRTDSPYASPHPRPAGFPDPPDVWQCSNGESGCVKDVASVGRCDYNRMTDGAFQVLFGGQEEGPFVALTDSEQEEVLRAARQINGAVGAGQVSFSTTVEATLATVQKLVNEGRSQTGTIAALIQDVPTAVSTFLLAHPLTASMPEAEREELAQRIADLDDDLEADRLLDAMGARLQAEPAPA